MWAIRLPGGEYLDLPADFRLSFELNNQVFSDSDSSVLPGSFSFPVDITLSQRNKTLLSNPHLVNNASKWTTIQGVWVYAYGAPLFFGEMRIQSATESKVRVNIVANPLKNMKSTPLNELDLDGDRTFANAAAVLTKAKSTTTAPLDDDYIFFPVFNPAYLNQSSGNNRGRFQNFYDTTLEAFSVDDDHPALMPFVRLEYILDKIFEGIDYVFNNKFQITEELRRICLYNNRSLWTAEGLATTINLQNHVSETASTSFLRKIMGGFCLGLFSNPWSRVIDLIPMQTLFDRATVHDWTQYAIYGQAIEDSKDQPKILCWLRDDDDGAWEHYDKYKKPDTILGEKLWSELPASADGNYYVTDRHAYYYKGTRYIFLHQTLGCAPSESGKPVFDAECQPLWDVFLYGEGQTPVPDGHYDLLPHCRIPGSVEYLVTPSGGGDPEPVQQEGDIPDRITIYRGMYDDFDGNLYPLASGLPWDGDGNLVDDYSLRWDGEYGMYASWWKGWHNILINGKHVTQAFAIPIGKLIDFSFQEKVRVQSMDYFLKKIRVQKLLGKGLVLIEANMVSVI